MTSSSNSVPLCINCGFIGASKWVGGFGPYCGRCASQAAGPDQIQPSIDDQMDDQMIACAIAQQKLVDKNRLPPIGTQPNKTDRPPGILERHDYWYECGTKHAKYVDPVHFGPHRYTSVCYDGTSDCFHGCGCWMGPYRSGGPVNPFGACPNNPKKQGDN